MKAIAISMSLRANGNCSHSVDFIVENLKQRGIQCEKASFANLEFEQCGYCGYYCFKFDDCLHKDDITLLYEKCKSADLIIAVVPTYNGHLSSSYFVFSERAQGIFKTQDIEELFLKKLNLIVVGNLENGVEMAIEEALYNLKDKHYGTETIILASREFGLSAIRDNIVENNQIKNKLSSFLDKIMAKKNAGIT